jgi:hypothetical protein
MTGALAAELTELLQVVERNGGLTSRFAIVTDFLCLRPIFTISFCFPVANTIPQENINTTIVRIAVAKFEFIFSIPILAKIDVKAANTADNNANMIHINPPKFFTLIIFESSKL